MLQGRDAARFLAHLDLGAMPVAYPSLFSGFEV
jgi:hypothetical protein